MTRKRTKHAAANKQMYPCLCCGVPFLQNLNEPLRTCNSPECLKLQAAQIAKLYASEPKIPNPRPPSDQSQRYSKVDLVESIDTASGLAKVSVTDDDAVADADDNFESAKTKRTRLKQPATTYKPKKYPSLEQAIVAVPLAPKDPESPFGRDPNTDLPIRPPLMGIIEAGQRLPVSKRCEKHPDYPADICFKCREEDRIERVRREAASAAPLVKPVAPPQVSEDDLKQRQLEYVAQMFGQDIKRGPSQTTNARIVKPYEGGREVTLSLRSKLGISREEIVEWLALPEVLYVYDPEERVVYDKKLVEDHSAVEVFEKWRAERIAEIENEKTEAERILAENKAQSKDSGLDGRTIAGMTKKSVNIIRGFKAQIAKLRRAKAPTPTMIEVEIPETGRLEKLFSGPTIEQHGISQYTNSVRRMEADDGFIRGFENQVIIKAAKVESIRARYPEIVSIVRRYFPWVMPTEPLEAVPTLERAFARFGILGYERLSVEGREEDRHEEADAHSMGLRIHGKGTETVGQTYKNKRLESFDYVRGSATGSSGPDNGGPTHPGAPDYDPSDDPN